MPSILQAIRNLEEVSSRLCATCTRTKCTKCPFASKYKFTEKQKKKHVRSNYSGSAATRAREARTFTYECTVYTRTVTASWPACVTGSSRNSQREPRYNISANESLSGGLSRGSPRHPSPRHCARDTLATRESLANLEEIITNKKVQCVTEKIE